MMRRAGALAFLAALAAAVAAFGALVLPRLGAGAGETVLPAEDARPVLVSLDTRAGACDRDEPDDGLRS
jgi:hypothetical protein